MKPFARSTNDPTASVHPGLLIVERRLPLHCARGLDAHLPPAGARAGLPASPLRGRITRPDVRVSLRTSPRPAPRPRASSSGGRRISGGPATLAASPHPQVHATPPPASHHVGGRAEEAVPQSYSGRARAGAPGAAPRTDGALPRAFPGQVVSPWGTKRRPGSVTLSPLVPPSLILLPGGSSLLPLPTPSPCQPLHPGSQSPVPCPWHPQVPYLRSPGSPLGFPGCRSPYGSSRAPRRGCRAGAGWRGGRLCKVALVW